MLDDVLTTAEVASLLRISPTLVRKLMTQGKISGWRLPTTFQPRRTTGRSVAAYLATQPEFLAHLKVSKFLPGDWTQEQVDAIVAEADRIASEPVVSKRRPSKRRA